MGQPVNIPAPPAQGEPREHGDVLVPGDLVTAARARTAAAEAAAFPPVEHAEPDDHHVEETSHQQPEQADGEHARGGELEFNARPLPGRTRPGNARAGRAPAAPC